jgi:hypothetical protein
MCRTASQVGTVDKIELAASLEFQNSSFLILDVRDSSFLPLQEQIHRTSIGTAIGTLLVGPKSGVGEDATQRNEG